MVSSPNTLVKQKPNEKMKKKRGFSVTFENLKKRANSREFALLIFRNLFLGRVGFGEGEGEVNGGFGT